MFIPKKYLTETVILLESRIDDMSILRILAQNKQIKINDADAYYKKLAEWANKNQEKTGQINLDNIKLSDRGLIQKNKLAKIHGHLGGALNQLKNLMDQEGKYNPTSELSNLIQKTTLEILAGLSGIKNTMLATDAQEERNEDTSVANEDSNEPDIEKYPEGKIDWTAYKAKKLADDAKVNKPVSKSLEEFYELYYRKEYAGLKSAKDSDKRGLGIVAKLKSLDKILIPEFNKLGYNPEVNPFAQFLKSLIEYRPDIFEKLNTNNYGAIHNSFIDGSITGNMLGNYSTYKDNTILYCSDLYNYKGLDIVNYLSLQSQALDKAERDSKYSDDKDLIAKMFIQQDIPDGTDYPNKIEYLFGQNPDKSHISKVILPDADKDNAKMKSVLEISEIYNQLFGAAPKKQINIDELVNKTKVKNVIFDMLKYLIDQDDVEKAYKSLTDETELWLKGKKYKRSDDNIKTCKEILSGYVIKDTRIKAKIITALMTLVDKNEKDGAKA